MRDLESRIRAVVKRRTPKGWRVKEHGDCWNGGCDADKKIVVCPPLKDRQSLLIFLHEVAHFVLGHLDDPTVPLWRREFEAEQWAVKAARAEGIAVPNTYIGIARYDVRGHVEQELARDTDAEIDEDVLRFCYPDSWRLAA